MVSPGDRSVLQLLSLGSWGALLFGGILWGDKEAGSGIAGHTEMHRNFLEPLPGTQLLP